MSAAIPSDIATRLKEGIDLIPAIAQDAKTGEVLMLAYMNLESLAQTLATGKATYWSRSRSELWVKGATSGHTQEVVSISLDCDGDALLMKVNQVGAACHTGDKTCFHNPLQISAEK
jgi:phosphoribosyl-AMP cyclohydrolase